MRKQGGFFEEIQHPTYGGRMVDLLVSADPAVTNRARTSAITRKAKLYGRYLGWAEGPLTADYPSGVIGIAGERVLAASTRSLRLHGFAPVAPAGEVGRLVGTQLAGGSYDDAAYLTVEEGAGLTTVLIPVEMKNIRRWIYSDEAELHKFLYRSAWL